MSAEIKFMNRMAKYAYQDYNTSEDNLSDFKLTHLERKLIIT